MWRKNEKRKDSVIAYKKVSEKVAGAVPVMTTKVMPGKVVNAGMKNELQIKRYE